MSDMNNPFTITFGMEPSQYINRFLLVDEIEEMFCSDEPSNRVYMISGVRGSGKTVMLTSLSELFSNKKDWIVVNASVDSDIINKVASRLYNNRELRNLFTNAKLDFSALGFGVSLENGYQIFDIEIALEEMLAEIKKKKKRVLILIDEIVNNENVRILSSTFQILIREKLPVYLVMTGLYDNIYNLQNEKSLTFLYRAPKIVLEPLSLSSIARSYMSTLDVDKDTADNMAKITKGYPFAYQVMGYLYWQGKNKKDYIDVNDIIPKFDEYLENYVYEKMWYEFTPKEREILAVLDDKEFVKVAEIREKLSLSSGEMAVYRDRLNKKGIIDTGKYGYVGVKLPRFKEIISYWI